MLVLRCNSALNVEFPEDAEIILNLDSFFDSVFLYEIEPQKLYYDELSDEHISVLSDEGFELFKMNNGGIETNKELAKDVVKPEVIAKTETFIQEESEVLEKDSTLIEEEKEIVVQEEKVSSNEKVEESTKEPEVKVTIPDKKKLEVKSENLNLEDLPPDTDLSREDKLKLLDTFMKDNEHEPVAISKIGRRAQERVQASEQVNTRLHKSKGILSALKNDLTQENNFRKHLIVSGYLTEAQLVYIDEEIRDFGRRNYFYGVIPVVRKKKMLDEDTSACLFSLHKKTDILSVSSIDLEKVAKINEPYMEILRNFLILDIDQEEKIITVISDYENDNQNFVSLEKLFIGYKINKRKVIDGVIGELLFDLKRMG